MLLFTTTSEATISLNLERFPVLSVDLKGYTITIARALNDERQKIMADDLKIIFVSTGAA